MSTHQSMENNLVTAPHAERISNLSKETPIEVDKTTVLEPKVKLEDGKELDETKLEEFFLKI